MVAGLTDVAQVVVEVRVHLDRSGEIVGQLEVSATGGPDGTRRAVEGSARRAVTRSAPFTNLPPDKYDGEKGWNTLLLTFTPEDFGV